MKITEHPKFIETRDRIAAARRAQLSDVFTHTEDLILEIAKAITEARSKVNKVHVARMDHDLAAMVSATSQIQTLLRQSSDMVASLRTVLEFHRSRQSS